jgi:hypothetical protein
MSSFVPTIVGAVAAISGGLVGAVWQTRRSDDVARRIRRAERREHGLLQLASVVAVVETQLTVLQREAERGLAPAQYERAVQSLHELRTHWDTVSSGVIPDGAIVSSYAKLRAVADRAFPADARLSRLSGLESAAPEVVEPFVRDLEHVLVLLANFREIIRQQVKGLMHG